MIIKLSFILKVMLLAIMLLLSFSTICTHQFCEDIKSLTIFNPLEFQMILAWNYFHWYLLQGSTSFVLFVLFWKISCTKFTMNMSSLRYGDASVLPSTRLIDHYSVSKTSSPYYWGGLIVIKFNHNSRETDR